MIEMTLTDGTGSDTLALLNVPLTEATIEGAVDVQTLDNNISTYFTDNKRSWSHTWAYMTKDEYDTLKGYYDRQWVTYLYPLLTISQLSISNIPVRMYLEPKNIIDNCETVQGVTVSFRETGQNGSS